MTEQPSEAQLQEWEKEHPRRDYVDLPILAGRGLDWCIACRRQWPCPFMQLVIALRADSSLRHAIRTYVALRGSGMVAEVRMAWLLMERAISQTGDDC